MTRDYRTNGRRMHPQPGREKDSWRSGSFSDVLWLDVKCRPVTVAPDTPEILSRFTSALDLVAKLARQMKHTLGPNVSVEELDSCGREGLLDAARRFDVARRVPFRAYASLRIRGAMIDGVRQMMPLPRRTWQRLRSLEGVERVTVSLSEELYGAAPPTSTQASDEKLAEHLAAMATAFAAGFLAERAPNDVGELVASDDESPESLLQRRELREFFEQAILELPAEEATLIRRHYLDGERFDHVAASIGLSKSWASRLHRRAIDRLAKRLRALGH